MDSQNNLTDNLMNFLLTIILTSLNNGKNE
jgi:hypothetical protein